MEFTLCQYQGNATVRLLTERDAEHLTLQFQIPTGDFLWPSFNRLMRRDNIWRSTCVELFVAFASERTYFEMNASPDGSWNCYRFDDYRSGMRQTDEMSVTSIMNNGNLLEVAMFLPALDTKKTAWLNPAAVLEQANGGLTYFAPNHGAQPDFHLAANRVQIRINDL